MYLLSKLLEKYIRDKDSINCRHDLLYLNGLIEDMSLMDIAYADDVACVRDTFENLMEELCLLKRYGCDDVNLSLLLRVALDEYRNGYYDSACDFLYYRPNVAEMIKFPYRIDYSSDDDAYHINGMEPGKAEEFATDFLNRELLNR